ncbi:MAG: hypothetical protein ACE37F_31550 [Nannocystaceae bacterium]|nr:hypothetical protein [bacterium]
MRFRTLHFGVQHTLAIAGLALGLAAGCNGDGDGDASGASCVQGQVNFCPCPGDLQVSPSGTQTCLADNTYGPCMCGDVQGTESDSGGDTEDTAESDSESEGTDTTPDLCGNGFPDPGECEVGPDGGMAPCPEDCMSESDTDSDTDGDTDDTDGTTGSVDVCAGVPIYVGNVPASPSVWLHPGFGEGFTSGTQACIAAGYEGVCTYTQLVEASDQGDFAAVPAGTTFWVHRVVATMFEGVMIQPDTRSRCDDWRYGTNDVNDGEYATVTAGALDFTLDADPNPNGGSDPLGLDCGGITRAIPCCNVCEG